MLNMKYITLIVQLLLVAGAYNWGLVAYNGTDLVKLAVGEGQIERYIKYAIALAGLFAVYELVVKRA